MHSRGAFVSGCCDEWAFHLQSYFMIVQLNGPKTVCCSPIRVILSMPLKLAHSHLVKFGVLGALVTIALG